MSTGAARQHRRQPQDRRDLATCLKPGLVRQPLPHPRTGWCFTLIMNVGQRLADRSDNSPCCLRPSDSATTVVAEPRRSPVRSERPFASRYRIRNQCVAGRLVPGLRGPQAARSANHRFGQEQREVGKRGHKRRVHQHRAPERGDGEAGNGSVGSGPGCWLVPPGRGRRASPLAIGPRRSVGRTPGWAARRVAAPGTFFDGTAMLA